MQQSRPKPIRDDCPLLPFAGIKYISEFNFCKAEIRKTAPCYDSDIEIELCTHGIIRMRVL